MVFAFVLTMKDGTSAGNGEEAAYVTAGFFRFLVLRAFWSKVL